MNAEKYMAMRNYIVTHDRLYKFIRFLYKASKYIHYVAYPLLIIYLLICRDLRVSKVIVVPAETFILVTIIRKIWNLKRPYEVLDITPLFPKTTKGKSCPSRHTASTVIISFAFLYVNLWLGIASFVVSAVIAVLRPIAGVHFPRDVIWAILFSVFVGILGFYIL
jgi:membrane-associated phospholipid phosphatase